MLAPALAAQAAQPSSSERRSSREFAAKLWVSTWFIAIPLALTLVMMRYCVPSTLESRGTILRFVSQAVLGNALISAVCLFLAFSVVIRHWRHTLPGFRLSLPLTSGLDRRLSIRELAELEKAASLLRRMTRDSAVTQRKRDFDPDKNAAIEGSIGKLKVQLANGDLQGVTTAVDELQGYVSPALTEFRFSDWMRVAAIAAAPILLAFSFRAVVFQSCKILGSSMLPTLQAGDSVGIRPSAYRTLSQAAMVRPPNGTPKRGDVIVFDNPESTPDEYLVKRVIGIPGDEISMKNGPPTINGWNVPYCDAGVYANVVGDFEPVSGHVVVEFLEDRSYLTLYTFARSVAPFEYTYKVKDDEVFVLGDNRHASSDSRSWNNGRGSGVAVSKIRGRVDWFLVGETRNGRADFTRLLKHLDVRPQLEGLDVSELTRRINDCIRKKPSQTWPPPPS